MLDLGKSSTNSLIGLENTIPPRPSVSVGSSFSDVNKPLPLTPTEEENETRPSSIYSTEINNLIELYLGGSTSSKTSSGDARLFLPESSQCMPSDASNFYGDGKYSVSESALCSTPHTAQIATCHNRDEDEFTIKYRYSNPEGRSPTTLNSLTHDYLQDDPWAVDSAKKYRDTLLPTPFTPVSVKNPDLFPDIVPLHGPRFVTSSPSESISQSQSKHQSPTTNPGDKLDKESPRSSTYGITELTGQRPGLRDHNGEFLWSQHSPVNSEGFGEDRSLTPDGDYGTLTSKSPRPIPSPYLTGHQAIPGPYPTRSSSYSNHDSESHSSNSNNLSLPRNWSPYLKPSNPAIPRVPRSERSPAIGLSAYQALGPKAWKTDKQKEQEQSGPLLFGSKKITKHFTSKLKSLDMGISYLGQVQHRPHSSQLYSNLRSNVSDKPSPHGHSMISSSSNFSNGHNSERYLSLAHTDGSVDLSASSVKTLRLNSGLGMTDSRQSSKEANKKTSWFMPRKQQFIDEKHESWRKGMKDKITVIAAHDGVGLFGDNPSSTMARGAQYSTPGVVDKPMPKSSRSMASDCAEMPDSNWI